MRQERFRPKKRFRDGISERILKGRQVSEQTGAEVLYLTNLIRNKTPVGVTLQDGQTVYGWIEYYDKNFVRLTRDNKPNLFIYKDTIQYVAETKPGS
jgi:host factor-I protein